MTQTEIADALRARWDELWKLSPAERRVRIDEILRGEELVMPLAERGGVVPFPRSEVSA